MGSSQEAKTEATFEFITDGAFGPSVLSLQQELDGSSPLSDDIQDLQKFKSRVRLIRDSATAEALLAQASDVILSIIPSRGTGQELREQARNTALRTVLPDFPAVGEQ